MDYCGEIEKGAKIDENIFSTLNSTEPCFLCATFPVDITAHVYNPAFFKLIL